MALLFVGSTIKSAATLPRCTAFISGLDGVPKCRHSFSVPRTQNIICNTHQHQHRFSTVQLANTISDNDEHDDEQQQKRSKSQENKEER